jgi:hypothetical protein
VYPSRDWRVQLSNVASFAPHYQVRPVAFAPAALAIESADGTVSPSADPSTADENAVSRQQAMQYGSSIGLTHTYSARSSISVNYSLQYTQFFDAPDSRSQRAGVGFTQGITKDLGVRLGYAYGVAVAGADLKAAPIRNNDLDLGIAYGRSFSPSSRTSFGFSTGSTIVSSGDGRHFGLTGSGQLTRRLSPKWTARLLYDRGLSVPEGVTRPVFSDRLAASVSGYFTSRVNLSVQPSYAHGVVGSSGLTNSYHSYTSSTRLGIALGRRLALYVEHFYYQYQFASGVGLPALLTTGMNRQGARIGLSLWTPLVQ